MYISQETPEQTRARLLEVIARTDVVFFEGTFAFEEFRASDFPRRAASQALALIRDAEEWSQLVPSYDPSRELFSVFGFHFANELDNSGFVGWLATHLKETLGTGVFVICGHNSRRGGIFDYWGCPARLIGQVKQAVEQLRAQSRSHHLPRLANVPEHRRRLFRRVTATVLLPFLRVKPGKLWQLKRASMLGK